MHTDRHNAMREIVDRSLAGEASAEEQQRLREHLRECAACQQYAEDGRRAIAGLGGFSFGDIGQEGRRLEEKVVAALITRAQQLDAAQLSRRRFVRSCLVALLLTVAGTLVALQAGGPLAAILHLPPADTQVGVLALWVLPSWVFTLAFPCVLLLFGRAAHRKGSVL